MSDILNYYKTYHAKGGEYHLEPFKNSSRCLAIITWLRQNVAPGEQVLDIGCGDGSFSRWAPEYKWTGLDINAEKDAYNGTRLVSNVETLPYALESGTFGAIVCSEVLEHLWAPEAIHTEAHRLLKPRGAYIISTPNVDWIEYKQSMLQLIYEPTVHYTREHIRLFNFASHTSMLHRAGFKVADYIGTDPHHGTFFQEPRAYLKEAFEGKKADGEIDYLLGRMFSMICPGIAVLSVKS